MVIQFTIAEQFNLPADKVFIALTDFDETKKWMKGLVSIEKLKGDKVETGSEWRATRKMFGKNASEVFEAVSIIPYKEIKLKVDGARGSSKKGIFLFNYIFSPTATGTQVEMHGEILGFKGFAAFMCKLMMGFFKKSCGKDLKSLKEYLEKG
jgi:hypothetical protein